jgi:uncharacterized membrane protein
MIELLAFVAILLAFVAWPFMVATYANMWKKAFGYSWLTAILLGMLSTLPIIGVTTLAVLAFSKWTGDKS